MAQKLLIIEKRTADGRLDFTEPRPPFIEATENQLCDYYFRNAPKTEDNAHSADLKVIYGWYNAQGFQIRPKTW